MIRAFIKETLLATPEIECFCVVPGAEDGLTAEDDREFLRHSANIPEQTHSLNVGILENPGQIFSHTDALITFQRDTAIGVVTADCVPIILYAPDIHCAGAIHAGWMGTLGGIIECVLDVMVRHGADPSKMTAVFGPSISQVVYEVDRSLGDRFIEAGFGEFVSWLDGGDGKPHLDLQGVNMGRMLRRGMKRENIHLSQECTYLSSGKYHSYRRDGEKAGRQLTAIKLNK